jgi:hypothetical protein
VRWLVATLLLVPLGVAALVLIVAVGGEYMPISDHALLELKTRDIGHHAVSTGLYSRDLWSHPGPAQFYVLAVPYHLVGSRAIGLPLGALMVNGLATAGMVVIAYRRGGVPLVLLTGIGCALVMRALGPDFLRDPWSPYLPVLPFGLLILLAWEMTCGTAWAFPLAAAVASFCAQTHVGFVLIAFPLVLWGAAWLFAVTLRRGRRNPGTRTGEGRRLAYATALAAVITAVMWLPPLIEELSRSRGNISRTVDWFRAAREGTHSLGDGLRVVGGQFTIAPPWLTGNAELQGLAGEPALLFATPVALLLVPFALAALVFWRRRRTVEFRLFATVSFALVVGVVSVTRTVGIVYDYRLRWLWVTAMLASVTTAWAVWTLIPADWSRRATRVLAGVALAAIAALTVDNALNAARAGTPHRSFARPPLTGLLREVERALPPGDGDVVFKPATSVATNSYIQGLVLELERHGVSARVSEDRARRFGDHRVRTPDDPARAILTVVDGPRLVELRQRPNTRVIAYEGNPPRVLARRLERVEELERGHRLGRLSDEEFIARTFEIRIRAVGVVIEPA